MTPRSFIFTNIRIINMCTISDVITDDADVEFNTSAQLSCVVTGLTRQLGSVTWEKPGGVITDGTDGYKIDVGPYDDYSNSQTTVLTVPASQVTDDSNFTCSFDFQGDEAGINEEHQTTLHVFSK